MLKAIFNWFVGKPLPNTEAPAVKPEAAPYKVESPPVVKAVEPEPVVAQQPQEVTPTAKKPAVKKPAVKKPAESKTVKAKPAAKPAAMTAAVKKPKAKKSTAK